MYSNSDLTLAQEALDTLLKQRLNLQANIEAARLKIKRIKRSMQAIGVKPEPPPPAAPPKAPAPLKWNQQYVTDEELEQSKRESAEFMAKIAREQQAAKTPIPYTPPPPLTVETFGGKDTDDMTPDELAAHNTWLEGFRR